MSRTTASGASDWCNPFVTTKSSRKAITARFAGRPGSEWPDFAAWVLAFVCSPAYRDDTPATPDLLDWVGDRAWETLHALASGGSSVPVLTLTAGRYLSVSGVTGAFDLEEDEPVTSIPDDWVECRVFNLRTLYRAFLKRRE